MSEGVIARFAEATRPPIRPLADAETTALADLIARRRQIIQMITAEGQREKRASKRMKKSIQRLKKALQKKLAEIDRDIDDTVRGSPLWRHNEDLMASVPGVGPAFHERLIASGSRRWSPSSRSPESCSPSSTTSSGTTNRRAGRTYGVRRDPLRLVGMIEGRVYVVIFTMRGQGPHHLRPKGQST